MEGIEEMEGSERDILVGREPAHLLQNFDDLLRRRRNVISLSGSCRVRERSTARDGGGSGGYCRCEDQNKSRDGQRNLHSCWTDDWVMKWTDKGVVEILVVQRSEWRREGGLKRGKIDEEVKVVMTRKSGQPVLLLYVQMIKATR